MVVLLTILVRSEATRLYAQRVVSMPFVRHLFHVGSVQGPVSDAVSCHIVSLQNLSQLGAPK